MTNSDIREIRAEQEHIEAFDLIRQLRTHLSLENYLCLVGEMSSRGYRMFALHQGDKMVSVAGVEVMTNLYNLRHLWVYELITDASERLQGHGATLLHYVENFARQQSCASVVLSSAISRTDAHRFYTSHRYEDVSTVFKKKL